MDGPGSDENPHGVGERRGPGFDVFGLIVVGDEILNGRRRDCHFEGIGGLVRARGHRVAWLRILPDDPRYLTAEFARTMREGIPVFCCGGIGATPDDHTRRCAAGAAGVPLVRHPEAVATKWQPSPTKRVPCLSVCWYQLSLPRLPARTS